MLTRVYNVRHRIENEISRATTAENTSTTNFNQPKHQQQESSGISEVTAMVMKFQIVLLPLRTLTTNLATEASTSKSSGISERNCNCLQKFTNQNYCRD
jgi:hypothetical protein